MKSTVLRAARLAALSATALCAFIAPAQAEFTVIGSFIISSFLAVGAGSALPVVSAAAIGQFVVGAAIIGASVLSSVLAPKPSVNPGEYKNTFETGDSSEIRAIGRVRVAGLKAFGNTSGEDRYRLICHTKGRWTATEEHYLGGREVTVDSDGSVSSPPWSAPGASFVVIQSKDGDGTETAWPDLMSVFPSLWTADHLVRGIHQSLVLYRSPGLTDEKFLKLYQQGEPPYEKVGRAEPIYDPRDVAQDVDDDATWEWSDNGILCAAHVLRQYPSFTSADFDYDDIGLEATKAEAVVATKTGTEERSRASGMWPSEAPRGDIMEQVLRSIGAEIVPTDDNKYSIRLIDDTRTADITFTDKHLIDVSLRYGPESVERPNVCRIKYYAPERNYEMTEINLDGISWARIQDEIDNVGEQIYDIELPFCFSASQAQRIGRRLFALARADAGVAKFNFAGMAAWGLTTASIPFPDIGADGATLNQVCAIGTPRVNDEEGTVEIPFIVWPTLTAWNPATDEAAAPEPIPELLYESELDTPAAPSAALQIVYPDASREMRVAVAPVADAAICEATYRTYTAGEPNAWTAMTEPSMTLAYVAGDFEGDQIDFRVRYFDADENGSYNSELLEVPSLAQDNTALPEPTQTVTGTNGDWDVAVTIGPELRVASVKIQWRTDDGITPGPWTDSYSANARPGDVINHNLLQTAQPGEAIEIRTVVATSNGTATASDLFRHDEPIG